MTNYTNGRRFEYKARDQLRRQGFFVMRSAGSKSPVDLAAFKKNKIYFVQCKKDGKFPLKEKQILYKTAHENGAVPILAFSDEHGVAMREVEKC